MKYFVLDTNVLLHDPQALTRFDDNCVVVPIYVIEELDQFKKQASELGRNARHVCRFLDDCRERGHLGEGVPLDNGGTLRVVLSSNPKSTQVLNKHLADNLILAVAIELQDEHPDAETILITKDTNLRVRADALGVRAVNYEESDIRLEELYPGTSEVTISPEQLSTFYKEQSLELNVERAPAFDPNTRSETNTLLDEPTTERNTAPKRLHANEYVLLRNASKPNHTALGRFFAAQHRIVTLRSIQREVWGLKPRNKEQYFALDALLDDQIKLVSLLGRAGSGKTLLALAAGLQRTIENAMFKRILVSRPVFPLGRDIGHLPGTAEEKLNPWMQPIHDNLAYLLSLHQIPKRTGHTPEEMMSKGLLQIEPLTFIRGRSIPNQYLIVDEAQNLTPHEVKTIITRVGEGTKVVLTGDPYQIDNPYVDSESNGLTYTINRFKGHAIAATVTLNKGERSELATLAASIL